MPVKHLLFVVFGITFLYVEGTALECFSCSSVATGACGQQFNKLDANVEACTAASNVCFKGFATTPENKTIVIRSCGTEFHCMLYDPKGCYTCTKNLCNSGLADIPNLLLMVTLWTFGLLRNA